jgi:HSP20 family protein
MQIESPPRGKKPRRRERNMASKGQKKSVARAPATRSAAPVPVETGGPLRAWERAFDRLFDRMFDDFRRWPSLWGAERGWPHREVALRVPPVDVYEEKDQVVVKTELPGLGKDDVSLTLTEDTLTIKGEKKKEEEVKEEDYHRWERSYGSFVRTVELPVHVKSDEAKAEFKNGVLTVRLPKSEEAKRKQIQLKVE